MGNLKVLVPLAGLIDKDAELARLDKEIERKRAEVERLAKKLANENFVAKAPEAVVARERAKQDDANAALDKLQTQRKQLARV